MISDREVFDCLRRGTAGLGEYKPVMPDQNPALQLGGYIGSALSLSHGQAICRQNVIQTEQTRDRLSFNQGSFRYNRICMWFGHCTAMLVE